MSEIFEAEIIQGDTGPMWHIQVPTLSVDGLAAGYEILTDYTCSLVYTDNAGTEVSRVVGTTNTANDTYLVQMTSIESATLNVGKNKIVVQVVNAGVSYRSEVQIDLTVKAQRYIEP